MDKLTRDVGRRLVDLVLIPLAMVWLAYEPNFAHGFIDYFESGQYLSVINAIFHGKLPYKDLFVLFGPLHYWVPALAMLFFGKSIVVLRGFFLFGDVASLLVLYCLCRLFIRNRFFSTAAALLIVIEAHHPFWCTRWGGIRFAFGYLSLLSLTLFCKKKTARAMGWSGFFASVGSLFSQDVGLFSYATAFLFFILYAFWRRPEERTEKPLTLLRIYGVGCAVVLIPFMAWLVASSSLGAYVDAIASLPSLRLWLQPWGASDLTPKVLYPAILYVGCLGAAGYSLLRKGRLSDELMCLMVLCTYGILSYAASFRAIRGPQFQVLGLPIALLVTFYLLRRLYDVRKMAKTYRDALLVVIVAGLVGSFASPKRYYENLSVWLYYQRVKQGVLPVYSGVIRKDGLTRPLNAQRGGQAALPLWQADEVDFVVSYILSHSSGGEPLFSFPELGLFNFLCDRPDVSRFTLVAYSWPKQEWQKEQLELLKNKRPPIVLVLTRLSNLAASIHHKEELLPDVLTYVRKNYVLKAQTQQIAIYGLPDRR